MSQIVSSENWYALFVQTGREDCVKEYIMCHFNDYIRATVPKRKLKERKNGAWSYVMRTLFPGYVLLRGNIDVERYYKMKEVPGVIKFLRSGYELLRIEEDEIWLISRLTCDDEIIGISNLLLEDGRVIVTEGPLTSMEGLIVDINHRKGRAKVKLSFMGEPRVIELGVSVLQPA